MKRGWRSTPSSFSQAACEPEALLDYQTFLVYHGGGGYTWSDVQGMTFDELLKHVERLHSKLKAEHEARREQEAKAKMMSRSRGAKYTPRRR